MNNSLFLCFFKKLMLLVFVLNTTMLTILPMQLGAEKLEVWEIQAYSSELLERLVELRSKQTIEEIKNIKKRWEALIAEAYVYIDQDSSSIAAQQIFKEWMSLANEEYQDYDDLRNAKSLAYKNNQIPDSPFDQKLWDFLEKAAIYMYHNNSLSKTTY